MMENRAYPMDSPRAAGDPLHPRRVQPLLGEDLLRRGQDRLGRLLAEPLAEPGGRGGVCSRGL